jgi:hypothetical protein
MFAKEPFNTHIYYSVKPLHLMSQIVGLSPYSYVRNPQTGEEYIDISRSSNVKKTIWALVLLLVQSIGLLSYAAHTFINPPESLSDVVKDTIQIPFIGAVGMTAIVLELTINRNKTLKLVNALYTADKLLYHHPCNIHRQQNKILLITVVCVTVSSAVIYCSDVFYYFTYNILYVITIYVPEFIWTINELQFLNIVAVLKLRLTTLNANISTIFAEEYHTESGFSTVKKMYRRRVRNPKVSVSYIDSNVSNEPRRVRASEEFMEKKLQMSTRESTVTSRILKLSEIYNRIYEMCCSINSIYGFTLLQEFTAHTVCLTVDGYMLVCLLIALYKAQDPLIPQEGYPALLLWNVINFVKPFVLCLSCQRIENEFQRTVNSIETVKLHPDMNTEISNQLRLLANQIKHCKLEFTACDFFDINLSLFFCVVLTATTYIAVLVLLER